MASNYFDDSTSNRLSYQMKLLYLSPSSLNRFYDSRCPASWEFGRKLEAIGKKDEMMDRGTLVHSMMEGTVPVSDVTDTLAKSLYDKLISLKSGLNIQITETEVWQEFEIIPGVIWQRKIDGIGMEQGGKKILADYKTGGAWKVIPSKNGSVASPKSMGFQAIGYLIPPPQVKDWPKQVIFLVAPYRGAPQIFRYNYNKKDHNNLLLAIQHFKESVELFQASGYFPKVRGYPCENCDFVAPCYEEDGWTDKFKKKEYSKKGRTL